MILFNSCQLILAVILVCWFLIEYLVKLKKLDNEFAVIIMLTVT